MRIQSLVRFAILLGLIQGASGCTALGVKPWQREVLARPEMALNAEPIDAAIDDHIYFSKGKQRAVAAASGAGVADATEGSRVTASPRPDGGELCAAERHGAGTGGAR